MTPDQRQHHERVQLAKKLALLLDSAFEIPGTGQKVGLDPILGLVPGLGDAVSLTISLYILYVGHQLGLSRWQLTRMILNITVDTVVGSIPVLGDAFDLLWKSNMKNIDILEKHLETLLNNPPEQEKPTTKIAGSVPPGKQTIDIVAEPHPGDRS